MPLFVAATPIGNDEDLSPRARRLLSECDLIIGEEAKETRRLLKRLGLELKPIETLNEHSQGIDLPALVELCQDQNVVLVSDCGTPGFCDPGADLVAACRSKNIPVASVPGPCSLTTFLSLCGRRLDRFLFRGFLPANNEDRQSALAELQGMRGPIILMDTPYRLNKLLSEIAKSMPNRNCVLGVNLSTEAEKVFDGPASVINQKLGELKAEFVLLLESQKVKGKR